ncbi:MAG: polysaccharide biosynthesis tyrosine autokinase, partial [Planctomycetota bacterium]
IADYNQQITALNSEASNLSNAINALNRGFSGEGGIESQSLLSQQALQNLQRERSMAMSELETAKQAAAAFNSTIDRGLDPTEVQQAVDLDPEVQNLRLVITNLEIQREQLEDEFGGRNKAVRNVETQLRQYSARLEDQAAVVRSRVRNQLQTVYGNAVNSAQAIVDGIDDQIGVYEEQIASLTQRRNELDLLVEQREGKNKQVEQIQIYVSALRTAERQAGSVVQAGEVQTPDQPSFPKRTVVMGAAGVLGLTLALGLAFLRELTDSSVRSPRDISRVGQLTLLGMIPHEDDDPQAGDCSMCRTIEKAPGGIIAESFRQLRSRFNYAAPLETTRTVMVTSCGPEDGKTVVATNLATSLALAGRRVLLVDANFRRPELGQLFGVESAGFAAALESPGQLPNLVGATEVNGLSVLPAGEAINTNELIESHHFNEFVDRALEDFDQVIFDAGPVMLVSESAAMAPKVDGVITVTRAKSNSRGVLQRLRDHLRQLRAEHIGVVLNGVRAQSGGYYARNIRTFYDYSNKQLPGKK